MVCSWIAFGTLNAIGVIRRGFTLAFGFGTFLVAMGITTLLDPKIQGARDVKIIESEAVSSGERFGAQVGAIALIAFGLLVIALFLYIGFNNSFGDF